ncbi:DUF3575 domain-containing protein [Psychroserpens sp.]|uniref:DUF3575 domain-containing protein n=1 Tax=Psychroserpens sp. TaxID=2020870 RepID=UPI001B0189D7|nr:DUF3575 domain-containing protein [Psychroserpens sp.]MBO6608044.1 DUF3575 domain-containing protein [Psychroserpens sp.]MBO6631539.1 DUF3575 domain-containing protein [Psychroserpens sp.]MBO6655154.1 DUF3575 domain-containing protein [Psychroserpens sp.]MBO6683254.1 DUF3575 domain-containing protein [Psychroserpens sp.]MBO6751417.1 DUF3575 domain-containing protein [Psychroserpens sp.]
MKKLLLIVLLFSISITLSAQKDDLRDDRKNEIGVSVSDLVNGAFQLEYERMVGEHISIGAGIGFKGENGLIRLSGLDTDKVQTGDITYSGFKFIPTVRYYINSTTKHSMDGFYFGAFAKYSNYKSDLDGTYIDDADQSYDVEYDAEFSVISFGFMVGYKLAISQRFSLNFLIIGPGAGFHNYSLIQRQALPDEFFDDLNEALDSYSFFDFLNSDFRFDSDDRETNFVMPAFRYGITLGYSF